MAPGTFQTVRLRPDPACRQQTWPQRRALRSLPAPDPVSKRRGCPNPLPSGLQPFPAQSEVQPHLLLPGTFTGQLTPPEPSPRAPAEPGARRSMAPEPTAHGEELLAQALQCQELLANPAKHPNVFARGASRHRAADLQFNLCASDLSSLGKTRAERAAFREGAQKSMLFASSALQLRGAWGRKMAKGGGGTLRSSGGWGGRAQAGRRQRCWSGAPGRQGMLLLVRWQAKPPAPRGSLAAWR